MLNPKETFQAMAVRVLRQHRYCGDAYPVEGWPEVNAALAQYAAEKRHIKQYDAMMRRLRRRRRPRRLTTASTVTAAPVGLWDNEPDSGAAAGEPDR